MTKTEQINILLDGSSSQHQERDYLIAIQVEMGCSQSAVRIERYIRELDLHLQNASSDLPTIAGEILEDGISCLNDFMAAENADWDASERICGWHPDYPGTLIVASAGWWAA